MALSCQHCPCNSPGGRAEEELETEEVATGAYRVLFTSEIALEIKHHHMEYSFETMGVEWTVSSRLVCIVV